jgi:hypothetical protein
MRADGVAVRALIAQGRTPLTFAEGVFLAVQPPVRKPETIARLKTLMGKP